MGVASLFFVFGRGVGLGVSGGAFFRECKVFVIYFCAGFFKLFFILGEFGIFVYEVLFRRSSRGVLRVGERRVWF